MTKGGMDKRLDAEKSYFCSKGLKKPAQIKNFDKIKQIRELLNPVQVCKKIYKSYNDNTVLYKLYRRDQIQDLEISADLLKLIS